MTNDTDNASDRPVEGAKPLCGATSKRTGEPCKNQAGKGTNHPGEGRCKFHGGRSTGAKTKAGKETVSQNARKHGLYSRVLVGADLFRYESIQDFDPGEILRSNFYLVQARILGLLENDAKFNKDARVLLNACAILVENQEISVEFVDELKLRLLNLDVERLARILNSTTNLANAAQHLDRMGDIKRQLDIAKNFIVDVLRTSSDRAITAMAISAISELKLEAGLPNDALEELMERSLPESSEETPIDEDEDDEDNESVEES